MAKTEDIEIDGKKKEKTNIRTKRHKGTLQPRCAESIMEKQRICST